MLAEKEAFTKILSSAHKIKNTSDAIAWVLNKLVFCPFCSEYFIDSLSLSEHIKSEHANTLTSKTFTVDDHEVSKGAETIYICPHCHFAADNNCASPTSTMTTHLDSHTLSLVPNTKMTFQISNDKELIEKYISGSVKTDIFLCPICSSILSSKEALLRHLYLNHSDANGKSVSDATLKIIEECAEELPETTAVKRKYGSKLSF